MSTAANHVAHFLVNEQYVTFYLNCSRIHTHADIMLSMTAGSVNLDFAMMSLCVRVSEITESLFSCSVSISVLFVLINMFVLFCILQACSAERLDSSGVDSHKYTCLPKRVSPHNSLS